MSVDDLRDAASATGGHAMSVIRVGAAVLLLTVTSAVSLSRGLGGSLKRGLSAANVRWIAERLARLSSAPVERYLQGRTGTASQTRKVQRLRRKVDDGLTAEPRP